ncbi:MAG TPA: M48 family metalloprotease [Candidatus Binatia bacterium]|nr:M48 family metalloprotease [Candidatus Binatia bacterium]
MRTLLGLLLGLLVLATGAAIASERPDALGRRVDSIPQSVLLSQPATALVDGARQAGALRRAHWTVTGWILIQIFEAIALFYLWSSGGAAGLRDWLRKRVAQEWNVRFLFGAALALVARLAALIPSFYLYRVDRTLDLTFELTRWWLLYWAFHTILGMVIAGVIAAVVLGLVARTHQWYVYTIIAILAASVGWAYARPYVTLPDAHALFVHPPHSQVTVMVEGLPGSTPPEIDYLAAFELGHVVHGDALSIALIEGGVIIVFASIAVFIADRIRFRRDDDPLSRLAIVGALLALVYIVAVPVRNAAVRAYDFDADKYAVALTRDPGAAVRALVRSADERMIEVCPEWTARLFLYTAPGTGARVAAINRVPSACP